MSIKAETVGTVKFNKKIYKIIKLKIWGDKEC